MRTKRAAWAFALIVSAVAAATAPGCGSTSPNGFTDTDASDAQALGDSPGRDQGLGDPCVSGNPCGDGGVCAGSTCCAREHACGAACCGGKDVCSFLKCVTPGASCFDSSDCPPDQYCDYALGTGDAGAPSADASCVGGAPQKSGRCLPRPPICAPDAGQGGLTCLDKCEYRGASAFKPELKFAWGGHVTAPFDTDVMMAPIVIQLDDDNCDGKINEQDIPEIVFTTFTGGDYQNSGTLHAISIVQGKVVDKWSKPGEVYPGTQLAAGDLDGKNGNEIVTCSTAGTVRAYHGDGSLFWNSAPGVGCYMPSIADMDGDGKAEVIVEGGILYGFDGTTKATFSAALSGTFAVSDIDGDGALDVVTSSQAYHADGKLFVDTGVAGSWPAVGDFDKDGRPEIVAVYTGSHTTSFWHYDAAQAAKFSWVRQGVDINGVLPQHCDPGSAGFTTGGGPPTVADFDGDGFPDVALAGGIGYTVLSGAKVVNAVLANTATVLWTVGTTDCSSAATGSSVFDFDGDGKAEVVYSDENHLRIYEGPTGKVLFETCNTTGTLIEYPLVADVDNDGHADIVVVSNAYASGNAEYQCTDATGAIAQSGVRIFGDTAGSWVRTRRIWNEHAYHVTNVNEDGTIPKQELPNWKQPGLNNFRQNKQPGSEFAAPDAVVAIAPVCTGPYGLVATVTNIGEAPLPAGVVVGFYTGTPGSGTKIGSGTTTRMLYPPQSEQVLLPLPTPPAGVREGSLTVYAVVDDTTTPHPSWHECRVDNDTSAAISANCNGVK